MKSDEIFDKGLAVGSLDVRTSEWIFRFRGESFKLKRCILSDGRPNRALPIFQIPELRYGSVARIDDVREAMKYE